MMKHALVILAVGAMVLVGCGKKDDSSSKPAGLVAVVDLDRVAAAIGFTKAYQERMATIQKILMDQLREKHAALQKEYKDKEKQYGEKPTEAQQKELLGLAAQSNANLQAYDQNGGQQLRNFADAYIKSFREKVRPHARQIAENHGMSIVLTPGAQLLDFAGSVDITEEVTSTVNDLIKGGSFQVIEPPPQAPPPATPAATTTPSANSTTTPPVTSPKPATNP